MMALDISLPFPGLFSAWAGSAKRYWVTLAKRRSDRLHWNERQDNGDRDGENRDDRARRVPKKDENDDADDEQLFKKRVTQRINGPVDEIRAVIRRHHFDS